ncbi:MAG: hypothetical protein A2509_03435 [Candidatus Edwardsbacteria bacterium RIFOXYD12_FULL_50_11]|uniref:Uncharacterized protein n=1 Tax=Candidatus Edwardsbacteria bacterium GWF2_54_11 TaxID=1817851 RepID=A0A1F5R7W3_9BACT|nr:MAG: hypothetical protein A2502_03350 [Candidatus Edwardsbacteria bacterium RifOxyC12_full_54_24]OGF07749.1 MAG: hypothetical protein A2273_04600 [Candidatus Edwardsbacteria bacterium RifOxyA12_full_54_48]OGF09999.1 MAG: hypothetical protein A3K15_11010 [Candidatus Edwardsbacteria bacterium GWE2_54_12]OGF10532.1 MAG: hypothetical protein A2024_09300 [Candidatus Edwardsbacteria bacterium GWF2_54_11]OGF14909.1 MAG: hypothetical protein A2509_03435 [Candidatus Edwardsbacteria bacterium RIFOXYD1
MDINSDEFKDRSGGLKAFGVVLIILGAFNLLMIPLAVLGSVMGRSAGAGQSAGYWAFSLAVNLLTYLFLGGTFLWTGIDSIRLKRWVRPVLLSIGWVWLLLGLMVTALIFFLLPRMMGYFMPPDVSAPSSIINIVIAVSGTVSFIFMVLLPGLLVWFYSQNAVKRTIEAKDPGPAWTDACPPPVLAISLFYGVSAVLTLPASFMGVTYAFGHLITGVPAILIMLAAAVIAGYICYGFYKLDIRAWWVSIATTLFWSAAFLFTLSEEDMVRMFSFTGNDQNIKFGQSWMQFVWNYQIPVMIISAITFIAYLLYIKKYFKRT